ncbi:MAG: sporulation protein YqfD [Bacillota bacterium]
MGLYRFWAWFGGYLVIAVRGTGLERLLNLAGANGIYLWEIRRYAPDLMVACVGVEGFRRLRPFLRRSHCRAEILRKRGLVFLRPRLRRRPGLVCGALFFFLLLLFLANFIWWVEIVGPRRLEAKTLYRTLSSLGLHPGVYRRKIDQEKLVKDLELLLPAAAWVGVEVRGMVAVVRIVERAVPSSSAAADLVAARDGLITKLVVYRGTPVAAEGEVVRRGQVLVYGWEARPDAHGALRSLPVAARAIIEARVWDEAVGLAPLSFWREIKTGRRFSVIGIRLGPWHFRLGPARPHFVWFRQRRVSYGLGGGRNSLPLVEITFDRYDEVKQMISRRSSAAAIRMAAREAETALRRRLPKDARPAIRRTVRIEAELVTVVLTAETVQEIGMARPKGESKGIWPRKRNGSLR